MEEKKNTRKNTSVATNKSAAKPATAAKTTKAAKPTATAKTPVKKSPAKRVASTTPKATKVAATSANKKATAVKQTTAKKATAKKVTNKTAKTPAQEKTLNSEKTTKNVKKTIKNDKKTENSAKNVKKAPQNVESFKTIQVEGYNGLALHTLLFENVKNPKAAVLIIHGMQEHCTRYTAFAEYLNAHGYIVVASDLRGHGQTMKNKNDYGKGEKDIFAETLEDQKLLIKFILNRYNLPLYVFGHSYGSFLLQFLVQQVPEIEKAVLCGTTNGGQTMFRLGRRLVGVMKPFKNKDKRGGIVEKMCITNFGKNFERGNWLTRDTQVFEKYIADEYCGGSFPFSFYYSMLTNMVKANHGISRIGNKKLFLIAGENDPVGQKGVQVKKLFKIYLENNINAKMKLYPQARHELLNETNKDEVYADVLNFLDEN